MTRIFYADVSVLTNEALFSAYLKTASPERQKKINSLKNYEDKMLSLGAYICYAEGMRHFNADSQNGWAYSPKGKPYFAKDCGLHFSLSHSDNIAVAAVSESAVGIDAERISEFREGVCRRFFTSAEARYVMSAAEGDDRKDRFIRIWTLKEAYAKMTGRGIGDFRNFEITPSYPPDIRSAAGCTGAYFFEFDILGARCALCIDADEEDVKIERLNLFELLIK